MTRKRFAPLINLLYGLVGIGEGIGRAFLGDAEGAEGSFAASIIHLTSGALSYTTQKNVINLHNASTNLGLGIMEYLSQLRRPSTSLTYTLSPVIHMIQIGTNSLEAYKKKE